MLRFIPFALIGAFGLAGCNQPVVLTGDPVKDCLAYRQLAVNALANLGNVQTAAAVAAAFAAAAPFDKTAKRNADLALAAQVSAQTQVTLANEQAASVCAPKP